VTTGGWLPLPWPLLPRPSDTIVGLVVTTLALAAGTVLAAHTALRVARGCNRVVNVWLVQADATEAEKA